VVAKCPTETAPFGCVGGEREIEAYDASFEDHQEGKFQLWFVIPRLLIAVHPAKYGGLDSYLLNTKTDFLGQEGMRLRVLVREHQNSKAFENAKEMRRAP
jgi:hypothetical protein